MSLAEHINRVIIPGDVIGQVQASAAAASGLRLGQGLRQDQDSIVATKAGILRHKAPDRYWIETNQKRYAPSVDDMVIGVVTDRHGEGWKVDIGTSQPASLSIYSFESGTKRNRANLQVGSLVYARVTVANKDMEPELSCMSSAGRSDGFGPLIDGYMFKASQALARECIAPESVVLKALGAKVPFEIAVGLNGRIWVHSGSITNTILITKAIQTSETLTPVQINALVSQLLKQATLPTKAQ